MNFGLEPIGNVNPRPRIDLNPKWTRDPNASPAAPVDNDECERINRRIVASSSEGDSSYFVIVERRDCR